MKRTLWSTLFFMVTVLGLQGQDTQFGIKGGLNYSSIVGDLTEGVKFRFSGHAGVFALVDISYKFKLQPELIYSSQGFQFSSDLATIEGSRTIEGENDFRTNVQLNYLTVPILAKFALNENLDLEFGPQFGFLLNQVTIIKNLDQLTLINVDRRTSISGDFQLDYGAAVGLGIKLSEHFTFAPRFYLGVCNRLNGLPGDAQNYNVALQGSLNYLF